MDGALVRIVSQGIAFNARSHGIPMPLSLVDEAGVFTHYVNKLPDPTNLSPDVIPVLLVSELTGAYRLRRLLSCATLPASGNRALAGFNNRGRTTGVGAQWT